VELKDIILPDNCS